jgi:gluconate 2-dehydrogenase gamma chain
MTPSPPSRRDFLATSSGSALGAWILFNLPDIQAVAAYAARARTRGQAFEVLRPDEARDLEAIAAQIFPSDDTPGAREAGVVYFMDRALGTFSSGLLEPIRTGLTELRGKVRERHGATPFADLDGAAQAALLRDVENTAFFGGVRFLTVAGMFADPSYRGNREWVGWKLLGMDMRPAFQPPFGYYDREYGEVRQ